MTTPRGPKALDDGTNPVGGRVHPGGSDVRGTSRREDAMQREGSAAGGGTATGAVRDATDAPDLRESHVGTRKEARESER